MTPQACPCCLSAGAREIATLDGFAYFQCAQCELIFIDAEYLQKIDAGYNIQKYDAAYWETERISSKQRSYGTSLARMAEAFYYSRIPIERFLDVGTGAGYFLDAVAKLLPSHAGAFYGVEKYPPPAAHRSQSANYIVGDVADLTLRFDGGICIEVVEHLTPAMLRNLLAGLARASNPGALYVFNTAMPEYVLKDDLHYLDPVRRGHIMSYSIQSLRVIVEGLGFTVLPIRGKTWAFALEFDSRSPGNEDLRDRIWSAIDRNLAMLEDEQMGSALRVLGMETARAYP